MSSSGTAKGWRQSAAAILGDAALVDVESFELTCDTCGWTVSGLISKPIGGRRSRDSQLFFCNRRPIDAPKRIVKLINDTFHQYNSRMWPVVILSFSASQSLVDVNVTPDKRTVFFHQEEELLKEMQGKLTALYAPAACEPGSVNIMSTLGIKPKTVQHSAASQHESRAALPVAMSTFSFGAPEGGPDIECKTPTNVATIDLDEPELSGAPTQIPSQLEMPARHRSGLTDVETPEKCVAGRSSGSSDARGTGSHFGFAELPRQFDSPRAQHTPSRDADFQITEITSPKLAPSLQEVRVGEDIGGIPGLSIAHFEDESTMQVDSTMDTPGTHFT
jgi:hypothetical protein